MNVLRFAALTLVCALAAIPASARNDRFQLPLQATLDSPEFSQQVGTSVKFFFGNQPAPAGQKITEYIANDRQHFHGLSDEGACRATLISALAEMRDHAIREGGDAVVGIVSYFRRQTFSSPTDFECHAGSNGVFVSLLGNIVKLQN